MHRLTHVDRVVEQPVEVAFVDRLATPAGNALGPERQQGIGVGGLSLALWIGLGLIAILLEL